MTHGLGMGVGVMSKGRPKFSHAQILILFVAP